MRLVFLGPPGAGKGTQAAIVRDKFSVAHISTGDILRDNVKRQTPLGQSARQYMDAGKLVPDVLILDMMQERFAEADCSEGFILDGFPRTVPQAESLEKMLSERGTPLDRVILFDVEDDVVIERLCGRRTCKACGAIYHVSFHPPTRENVCDVCGGELIQRDDDKVEVIRKRLAVYHEQTAPLVDYYIGKGLLSRIDGSGAKDSVLSVLGASGAQSGT